MTETEYKEYLKILLGSKQESTTVRFYEWGSVPSTFQTSALSLSHEKGTLEGLQYDVSMTTQDVSAYIQFVQDSVALEKRRPVFTQYNPKSLVTEPEYASMFQKLDLKKHNSVKGFQKESIFLDECASTTDYSSSFDSILKIDAPTWCHIVSDNEPINIHSHKTDFQIPVLFQLNVISDMSFLRQVTEPFQKELCILVRFNKLENSETLEYSFDEHEKSFRNIYRGNWTVDALQTFLKELIRKDGITLLELNNGTILRERADGFWNYMLEQYGSSNIHIVSAISLRKTILEFTDLKTSKTLTKELESYQASILLDILQKAPAGLSLLQTFNMFQSKSTEQHVEILSTQSKLSETLNDTNLLNERSYVPYPKQLYPNSIHAKSNLALETLLYEFKKLEGEVPDEWNSFSDPEKEELTIAAFLLFMKQSYADVFSEEYIKYCNSQTLSSSFISLAGVKQMLNSSTEWLMEGRAPLSTKLLARLHFQLKVKPSVTLFRTIVGIFCDQCLVIVEGKKLSASEMWQEFQTFLRSDSDFPAYSTSQQSEFNETLTSYGFEQKRTSAGKMWLNVLRFSDRSNIE